jgi:GTPase SAR1 family protein
VTAKIIGVMGACGAGKTTITQAWLERELPNAHVFMNFADSLKQIARAHGWSGKKDDEGRQWLQAFSERHKAEHGELVFFNDAILTGLNRSVDKRILAYGDVRFSHEIRQFLTWQQEGREVALVYVDNPEAEYRWRDAYFKWYQTGEDQYKWAIHRSETEWRDFKDRIWVRPSVLYNDPTRTIFERAVDRFDSVLRFDRSIEIRAEQV